MPLTSLMSSFDLIPGINQGAYDDDEWIVAKDKERYDKTFWDLGPKDGKISGGAAKTEMVCLETSEMVVLI